MTVPLDPAEYKSKPFFNPEDFIGYLRGRVGIAGNFGMGASAEIAWRLEFRAETTLEALERLFNAALGEIKA